MKKYFYLAAIGCLALTSCEDVPAPYELFEQVVDVQVPAVAVGTGTVDDPYNVVMVNRILDNGEETDQKVYIKGIICKVPSIDTSYGNAIYYISDDGKTNTTFEIYRGYSLGGAKFTSDDEIQMGDTVVVYGVITNYNGTYETTAGASIYSLNGKTSAGGGSSTPDVNVGEVKGSGTEADPYNVAGILTYTKALPADANSDKVLYFKGIVSTVKEISPKSNFNNATFYISDDGTAKNEFYIYRCLGINKGDIESADFVKVGDEVVICGKVVNFKGNTAETVQKEAWIVSINRAGGTTPDEPETPDTPDVPDTPVDPSQLILNGDFELWTNGVPDNWKSASTASNATLRQSTVAHGGQYSVQVDGATANRRLAYKETLYAAGTYQVKFFAKSLGGATSSFGPQCRAGYVPVNGTSVGDYVYGDYVNLSETEWKEVSYEFTLEANTNICVVVMNPKNCGDILIDDYSITKK